MTNNTPDYEDNLYFACNKTQANDLACNKISLTEQWKKGELLEGFYYVNDGAEITIDYYLCDYWERHLDSHIYKVLAEVPDYVEWRNMVNCACEEHEANTELLEENAELKEIIEKDKKVFAEARIYPTHWISEDFSVKYDVDKLKEKIERLEKQLEIAVEVLEDIEKAESSTSYMAYCALQQIKELEK